MSAATVPDYAWPFERLGELMDVLAQESGLAKPDMQTHMALDSAPPDNPAALARWVDEAASWVGIEAEAVEAMYGEVEGLLKAGGPAILKLPVEGAPPAAQDQAPPPARPALVALLPSSRGRVRVLGPDLRPRRLPLEELRAALVRPAEQGLSGGLLPILEQAQVPTQRRTKAARAIAAELLAGYRVDAGWLLRLAPSAPIFDQLKEARLGGRLTTFLLATGLTQLFFYGSWALIGRAALEGDADIGWLLIWLLVLLSMVPFGLIATRAQAYIAIGAGSVMKRRLLMGALKLEPEEIKGEGVGHLLGRVNESEALESAVIGGALASLSAVINLVMAASVLAMGAGGVIHAGLLFGWTFILAFLVWRMYHRYRAWTDARVNLTHDVVERMVGHRTRLVQEAPSMWHAGEDQLLEGYYTQSKLLDRLGVIISAVGPQAWSLIGIVGLFLTFVSGQTDTTGMAIGIGGVVSGQMALGAVLGGLQGMVGAAVAWRQAGPLFRAAGRPDRAGSPDLVASMASHEAPAGKVVLEAHDVVYAYPQRPTPAVSDCNLAIRAGDQVLLEGPSGGGKSTLASLLVGLRPPSSGLLLLRGLDLATLGPAGWRRRAAASPQFHENHVFVETLGFNLLMGRQWPPGPGDLQEAEGLCRELGLGPVLDKMPGGINQMVGENGWQLSHGERSRVFLARALLQDADVVVLDESFAALDPENLAVCLQTAQRRAKTLIVIAHP